MAKHPVHFSWSAVLLAPLVLPVPAGVLFVEGSAHPVLAFGLGALIGYIITLAMVCCLLLPTLWLVSWSAKIKAWLPPVIGGLWAALIFLAWDRISWGASGVDSGPPDTTYPQWIANSWFTPDPLVVISCGVVTAAAYHFLATKKPNQSSQLSSGRG
jgi:ABC-type glycerol-3-phosphate transport system permease component